MNSIAKIKELKKRLEETLDELHKELETGDVDGELVNEALENWFTRIDTAMNYAEGFDVPFHETFEGWIKAVEEAK